MANELQTKADEPTLPGIMPSKPTDEIVRTVCARYVGNDLIAARLPTTVERGMLAKRREQIEHALQPIDSTTMGEELFRTKVLTMFIAAYPKMAYSDLNGTVDSYHEFMKTLPVFAVQRALAKIGNGLATTRNSRGQEVPLDPNELPSALYIRQLAMKEMQGHRDEIAKIDIALRVQRLDHQPEMTPDRRARVGQQFAAVAAAMKRGVYSERTRDAIEEGVTAQDIESGDAQLPQDPIIAAEDEARSKRDEARIAEANLARDRDILRQYAAMGIEPQYSSPGVLLSPALAKPGVKRKKGAKR